VFQAEIGGILGVTEKAVERMLTTNEFDSRREWLDEQANDRIQDQQELARHEERHGRSTRSRVRRRRRWSPAPTAGGESTERDRQRVRDVSQPTHIDERPSFNPSGEGPHKGVALQPAVASRRASSPKNLQITRRGAIAREPRRLLWHEATRIAQRPVGTSRRQRRRDIPHHSDGEHVR
jgi:hypothetical protein